GVLGLSGSSADIRDSLDLANNAPATNPDALIATQAYLCRLKKYLGAYLAIVKNPHAVIFTDTIGESVPDIRFHACSEMDYFGLGIDYEKNRNPGTLPSDVATRDSSIRILVIATNEELSIARSTFKAFEQEKYRT
ncbi:MAG: acetate kinase, partial [Kiritimatiellae bacterium]|nr:acetate kinase [Kiritimatiellia bacterium]